MLSCWGESLFWGAERGAPAPHGSSPGAARLAALAPVPCALCSCQHRSLQSPNMGQTLAQVGFCLLPGYQHGADTGEAARVWWCSSGKSPGQTGYASESAAGWCWRTPAASPAVLVRDHTFAIASQSCAPVTGHESCYNLLHFTFLGLAFPWYQLAQYRCCPSVNRADCPAGFMLTWRAPTPLQCLSHHCCCWFEPHAVVPALCSLGCSRAQRC